MFIYTSFTPHHVNLQLIYTSFTPHHANLHLIYTSCTLHHVNLQLIYSSFTSHLQLSYVPPCEITTHSHLIYIHHVNLQLIYSYCTLQLMYSTTHLRLINNPFIARAHPFSSHRLARREVELYDASVTAKIMKRTLKTHLALYCNCPLFRHGSCVGGCACARACDHKSVHSHAARSTSTVIITVPRPCLACAALC